MPRILIADDDEYIRKFLCSVIKQEGWDCSPTNDGEAAWAAYSAAPDDFDLVISDVRMPGLDGIGLLRRVREIGDVDFIVVSVLGSDQDVLDGLEAGADDYLSKPFDDRILVAKIKAAFRRQKALPKTGSAPIQFGSLTLSPEQQLVWKDGEALPLTKTEYGVLFYLMQNAGRTVSPGQILREVWGDEFDEDVDLVRVAMSRLRSKIEDDPRSPQLVKTRPGFGYAFADATTIESPCRCRDESEPTSVTAQSVEQTAAGVG